LPNETGKKRRILPWVIIPLLALTGASAIFLLSVPLDLTRFSDRIEAALEARVNGDIEIGGIVVKVLPSPEFTISQVEARYNGSELFSADRVYARVRLLPLLSGDAAFESIEARRPALYLVRDREGALNLSKFLKEEKPPEKEPSASKDRKISIDNLNVKGGRFVFTDRFPMQTASFDVTGINSSSTFSEKGTAFTASGKLEPATPLSLYGLVNGPAIEGQGIVEDLSLLAFNAYIKPPGARVTGKVDLDLSYKFDKLLLTKANVEYRALEASYPSTWTRPLYSPSGTGFMTLKTAKGLFDLAVDDIVINMKGFSAKGSLKVSGLKGSRSMDLRASSTPVDASQFMYLLPIRKMSPAVAGKVMEIKPLAGTVAVKDLRLAGKINDLKGVKILKNPQVSASLSVNDATIAYGALESPFTNVSGSLQFKEGNLSFTNLTGRYSSQVLERLSGRVKDLTGDGQFDVKAEGSLDIRDTLNMARSRAPGALKDSLMALEADGFASLNTHVSGSLKRKEPFKYSGETILSNASAFYKGVPLGFDSLDATVAFNNDRVTVKEARARSDSSSIALTGSVEGYRGPDPYFSFRSEGAIAAETLSKATGKGPEKLNIKGAVPFTLSAEGRKKDFRAKASVDATEAGVFIDRYLDKAPGFALKAEAEGGIRGSDARVENARVSFGGGSVVEGAGSKTLGAPDYRVSLISEQLRITDIDDISPYLDSQYASSGVLSFNVKMIKGPGQDYPSYDGHVKIKDGSFDTGLIGNPVRNVNASAEFGGNTGSLAIERVETGSTAMEGHVDVLDMAGRVLKFDLNFPNLHAEDLMPRKREEKPEKAALEEEDASQKPVKKKKPITGSGTIKALEGDLWNHQFKSLSADVKIENETVEIKPISLDIDGGKVSANTTIFLAVEDPRLFIADISSNGLLFERMTGARTAKRFLNGTARGKILLSGMKGDAPFAERINGTADIVVRGGRLWKFGFITDIFSFVNVISLDELFKTGLPYKDIEGKFTMNRGIISISELTFDSDSLRMSAVGSMRVPQNTLDLTLALHPFVTIDKIITNIPIVGWIITGKEESTVSFYFDIEGPVSDPDITPLPVKTIEKGVLGILERLIKAPFSLFK
jgi:hypothetical protein